MVLPGVGVVFGFAELAQDTIGKRVQIVHDVTVGWGRCYTEAGDLLKLGAEWAPTRLLRRPAWDNV
jgi:hypothetical protein